MGSGVSVNIILNPEEKGRKVYPLHPHPARGTSNLTMRQDNRKHMQAMVKLKAQTGQQL